MTPPVVGVVLAGGRSRRMGVGDKFLLPLAGTPVLDHVIGRARPQVRRLVLNANGDPGRFAPRELPIVRDGVPGFPGPLAGVLAGMEWARVEAPECRWIVTFPADTPFMPRDLVARLVARRERSGARIVVASSLGRRHGTVALWPVAHSGALRRSLADGLRKVEAWQDLFETAVEEFEAGPFDPFLNINEPPDLEEAERICRSPDGPNG